MARHRHQGILGAIVQVQNDANKRRAAQMRADAQRMRSVVAAQRQAEQARRTYERSQKVDERERHRLYVEDRIAETDALNEDRAQELAALSTILLPTISYGYAFNVHSLKQPLELPAFNPGPVATALPQPVSQQFIPTNLSPLQRMLPGAKERHTQAFADGYRRYEYAYAMYQHQEYVRQCQLVELWNEHEARSAAAHRESTAQHAEIDKWEREIRAGIPSAVADYFATVIDVEVFPEEFPNTAEVWYVPSTKELVVEYDLPPLSTIPEINAFRYIKARDDVTEGRFSPAQRAALYQSVVAQVTLSLLHIVTNADQYGLVDVIVFSGYADAIDRTSGRPIRACLVSVRAEKLMIQQLDLARVDPIACLKRFRAALSNNMAEAAQVKPLLTVKDAQPYVGDGREHAPGVATSDNLMDLPPLAFEQLVAALFRKMGLETELTKASHDGGIDCIAYDRRPVLGGELVIQVKRYRHTVPVSVVRDLFGAVQDRRAMKGILVTTSGYGSDSYKFAADKSLQLIDGPTLLNLLTEHMGMSARIAMPDESARMTA